MASTFDYINALNAQGLAHPLGPLTDISQNDAALAAYELKRQQDLQDMAQRNFFAQQLVGQQHQFQQTQAQQQQRAQMGLLEKGAQLRSQEAEKEFKLRTDEKHADERRKRLQTLYEYGGNAPANASDFEIEQGIQDRAGQSLANVFNTMGGLEKQIMAQSEEDPKVTHIKLENMVAEDPKFRPILNDYPELKKQFGTGLVDPGVVQDTLLKKTYSIFGPGGDARVNAFMLALNNAKGALAAQEALNPDAKKRPGYLQALNSYQILQKKAAKDIDVLRTPDRVQEAMKGLIPIQTAPPPPPMSKVQTVGQWIMANAKQAQGAAAQQPQVGLGLTGAYPLPQTQPVGSLAPVPSTVSPQAESTGYAVKVRTALDSVPSTLNGLVPPRQQRNTYSEMSDAEADQRVNVYITNLRAEIDRVTAQPGERGKASRLSQLRSELSRVSNLLK